MFICKLDIFHKIGYHDVFLIFLKFSLICDLIKLKLANDIFIE